MVTRAARRVGVGWWWWWTVASRGDRRKANSTARHTTGSRRALGAHARHAKRNANSRRESHRTAGAQGHLIDEAADDADRDLVREGSPCNYGLHLGTRSRGWIVQFAGIFDASKALYTFDSPHNSQFPAPGTRKHQRISSITSVNGYSR